MGPAPMNAFYSVLVGLAVIIAIAFSLLVLITGKGDAMGGGGSVRTTFKGKASFDDIMSKWTLYIGVAFMALVLVIDVVAKRLDSASAARPASDTPAIERNVRITPPPAANVPPTNAPASNPPAAIPAPPTNPPGANLPLNSAPATTVPSTVPVLPDANAASNAVPNAASGAATNGR